MSVTALLSTLFMMMMMMLILKMMVIKRSVVARLADSVTGVTIPPNGAKLCRKYASNTAQCTAKEPKDKYILQKYTKVQIHKHTNIPMYKYPS